MEPFKHAPFLVPLPHAAGSFLGAAGRPPVRAGEMGKGVTRTCQTQAGEGILDDRCGCLGLAWAGFRGSPRGYREWGLPGDIELQRLRATER